MGKITEVFRKKDNVKKISEATRSYLVSGEDVFEST